MAVAQQGASSAEHQHRAARARNASITCSMAGCFGGGARYPKRPSGRASSGWFEVRQKLLRGKPLLGLLRNARRSSEFVGDFHAPALSGLKLAIQTLQSMAITVASLQLRACPATPRRPDRLQARRDIHLASEINAHTPTPVPAEAYSGARNSS